MFLETFPSGIANTGAVLEQSRDIFCPCCIKLQGTVILNIPDRDHSARVLVSGFYMQKPAVIFDPIFAG